MATKLRRIVIIKPNLYINIYIYPIRDIIITLKREGI